MSEEISLDSLKNPDNINEEKNVHFDITEEIIPEEETHLEYKKRLNKKVSEFSDEEKSHYNKLAQKYKRKNEKNEEQVKKDNEQEQLNEEKKNNLYNQLFVLKQK